MKLERCEKCKIGKVKIMEAAVSDGATTISVPKAFRFLKCYITST